VTKRETKLQQRAVKAGIRAAKKRHHVLDEAELRSLKIQVMPALPRILLVVAGLAALGCGFAGIPEDERFVQGVLGVGGLWFVIFGIFGIRRTFSGLLDCMTFEAASAITGAVLEKITDAFDGV